MKKIVLDPDNGIVVTQDKTRKKRSTKEGNLVEGFGNGFSKNHSKTCSDNFGLIWFKIIFTFLGYAVKKIVLDPDNGIVVTQDKTRKKRSTRESNLIEWFWKYFFFQKRNQSSMSDDKLEFGFKTIFMFLGYKAKKKPILVG